MADPVFSPVFGDWARGAACQDQSLDVFFDACSEGAAKAICAACPVAEPCRQYIDRAENFSVRAETCFGIVAGETGGERIARRRAEGIGVRRRAGPNVRGRRTEMTRIEANITEHKRLIEVVSGADADLEPRRWRMAQLAFEGTADGAMTQANYGRAIGKTKTYVNVLVRLWETYGGQTDRPMFWSAFNTPAGAVVRPQYERVRERRDDPVKVGLRLWKLLPDDNVEWPPGLDEVLLPLYERLHTRYAGRRELVAL